MRSLFGPRSIVGMAFLFAAVAGCGGGSSSGGGGGGGTVLDPDAFELNNSTATCSGVADDFYSGDLNLHNQFDEDYFCFTLSDDSFLVVTVDFIHANGDVAVQLLDLNTIPIATSQTQQNVELITESVLAGQYFIRVYSPGGETNLYGLEIQAQGTGGPVSPDALEPNDTFCGPDVGDIVGSPYYATNLTIHDATDVDFFCFTLPVVTTVDIEASFFHSVGNLDLELLDSTQSVIILASSFTDDETVKAILPAGTFSVRVFGVGGDTNLYALSVSGIAGGGIPADLLEPNDDPASCSTLGDLSGLTSVPTFEALDLTIHTIDDEDYYCFTLSQDSNVTIDISFVNSDGNLDLELLDAAQSIIGFSLSYTDNERLIQDLVAGDYIIHVSGVPPATNTYNLSINVFGPDFREPNDDQAGCSVIPPLPFTDLGLTIHDQFDEDWFCFTLQNLGTDWDVTIDMLFQHWVGDLDMDLLNDQQIRIQFSQSRTDNEQITSTLPPGTYALRVYGFGGALNRYDVNIFAIQTTGGLGPDVNEPNNSFGLCNQVGNLPYSATGLSIHNSADSDYFCFSMTGSGNHTVTIDLTFLNANGDLDVDLYMDPAGQRRLVARAESASDNETLVAVVPAGGGAQYAARVYGYNGDTNVYNISIDDVNGGGMSADSYEPNNDFDLASTSPPNPQFPDESAFPFVDTMSIHDSVDEDYLSFQVTQPRSVMVDLTFLVDFTNPTNSGDLDMAILDDNQNVIARATSGTDNESLEVNVADGIEYRLWIYGFQGAMNTYGIVINDAQPIPPGPDGFEPNDDCASARVIPLPLSLPNLTIHDPATGDYYKVILQNPDVLTVSVSFTNALGDLDVELMDVACAGAIAASATTENTEAMEENLLPGEYVIHVYTLGVATNNYRLDVSTAAGGGGLTPDGYEFNDDVMSCSPIILGFSETALSIHSPIDLDFYCFTIGSSSRVTVELRFVHALGDVDVSMWCQSGGGRQGPGSPPCPGFIGGSSSFTDNELIDDAGSGISLRAGEYYIRVETAFNGTNSYEMYTYPF